MPSRTHVSLVLLVTLGLVGPACAPARDDLPGAVRPLNLPPGAREAAEAIDAETLSSVVDALADDALRGRGPSSKGDRQARQFIVDFLRETGFEAGGPDGSWEQKIGLVGITSQMPESWSFRGDGGDLSLAFWDEYIAASGVQEESIDIGDTEVVFVGYGITAPEENWDDFKGADLEGKVLLMLIIDPDWDPGLFAGDIRLLYGRWTYKY